MGSVRLEHLLVSTSSPTTAAMRTENVDLPPGVDPVEIGFDRVPGALSHSTSWRYEDGTVVLTFVHVLPDGSAVDDDWAGTPEDLESHPVACHAVRHLHFLRHTDPDVAAWVGVEDFWAFAAAVANHHYPAVAGLLSRHELDRMDFSI
jgi:hypothetical protein